MLTLGFSTISLLLGKHWTISLSSTQIHKSPRKVHLLCRYLLSNSLRFDLVWFCFALLLPCLSQDLYEKRPIRDLMYLFKAC